MLPTASSASGRTVPTCSRGPKTTFPAMCSDIRSAWRRRHQRRAYTLMELLLVMAIIVIVAAAATPSFRGAMRNAALSSAANDVRAALTRSHVMAMKTGRVHAFQYEMDGSKYKIEPWIGNDDALEGTGGDPSASLATTSATAAENNELKLPDDITFVLGDAGMESRGQQIEAEIMSL